MFMCLIASNPLKNLSRALVIIWGFLNSYTAAAAARTTTTTTTTAT
jgi:hypothetical protein